MENRQASAPLLPDSTEAPPASTVDMIEAGNGVEIGGVSVRLSGRMILDHISLSVHPGEFVTVLGSSGSGKTTLLRAIAGFVPIEKGSLRLGGRNLAQVPTYRRNIGFVHQQYALFPHLTVAENIAFGLRERRIAQAERNRRVHNYLHLVHLDAHANAYPSELSGGMQQRVALARALVIEPDLLLLDEPLSALDANLRIELRRELLTIHRRFPQLPIIYVTHDREEALQLADRIVLMRTGRIEQVGQPRQVYDEPANLFVARYLGPVNVLPVELMERYQRETGQAASERHRWIIRPEHVRCRDEGDVMLMGTVREAEWTGAMLMLTIEIASFDNWRISSLCIGSREIPTVGEEVQVAFSREDCRYVAEGE